MTNKVRYTLLNACISPLCMVLLLNCFNCFCGYSALNIVIVLGSYAKAGLLPLSRAIALVYLFSRCHFALNFVLYGFSVLYFVLADDFDL